MASVQLRWAITLANHLSRSVMAFGRLAVLKKSAVGKVVFKGHAARIPLLSIWVVTIFGVFMNLYGVGEGEVGHMLDSS